MAWDLCVAVVDVFLDKAAWLVGEAGPSLGVDEFRDESGEREETWEQLFC